MAREPHRDRNRDDRDSEFIEKLVHINRVAKVVKGGRRFGFAALVVVGDQKGRVGHGHGKAREVPEAIRKATEAAKRNLTRVPLREGRTLHHDVAGRHGAGKVFLRAAPPGTGIIAGGPMRAVFETLGMQDVVAKSLGSSNPYNMVRATFDALKHQDSPRSVAARRNIKVSTLQARRVGGLFLLGAGQSDGGLLGHRLLGCCLLGRCLRSRRLRGLGHDNNSEKRVLVIPRPLQHRRRRGATAGWTP